MSGARRVRRLPRPSSRPRPRRTLGRRPVHPPSRNASTRRAARCGSVPAAGRVVHVPDHRVEGGVVERERHPRPRLAGDGQVVHRDRHDVEVVGQVHDLDRHLGEPGGVVQRLRPAEVRGGGAAAAGPRAEERVARAGAHVADELAEESDIVRISSSEGGSIASSISVICGIGWLSVSISIIQMLKRRSRAAA